MSLILRCVPSVSRNLILLQPFHPCTTISKAGAFIFNLQSCVLLTHHHWHSNRYCHPSNLYHSISYPSSLCFPFSASCDCYTSWFCTSLPFVKYWYLKLPFFSMGMRLKKIISHSVQGNLFVTLTFFYVDLTDYFFPMKEAFWLILAVIIIILNHQSPLNC